MPLPTAYLVTQRRWKRLLLLTRWHRSLKSARTALHTIEGPLANWPPPDAALWKNTGKDKVISRSSQHTSSLTPKFVDELADALREWAPEILAGSSTGDRRGLRLETIVDKLDQYQLSHQIQAGIIKMEGAHSTYRHSAKKMLECLRLASFIKGGSRNLALVVEHSLRAALPGITDEDLGSAKQALPSRSLVQLNDLALDVGLVYCQLDDYDLNSCRVSWSDSSPVAGFDWIWSQAHEVKEDRLLATFDAVLELAAATKQFCKERDEAEKAGRESDADEAVVEDEHADLDGPRHVFPGRRDWDAWDDDWAPHLKTINDNVIEWVSLPGALGSCRAKLEDKVAAEAYKWALQTPMHVPLSTHAESYEAQTSDMGTELGLPEFQVTKLEAMLPPWFIRDATSMEAPDLEEPVRGEPDQDYIDDGPCCDLEVEHDAGEDDAGRLGPGQDSKPMAMMPNGFTLAGVQHVVNNLNQDVHQSLSHWKAFFKELHNALGLLGRDDRRQRYCWTCLRGTPYEAKERLFESWSKELYEPRWREVLEFLKAFIVVLWVMTATWDDKKYESGLDARGQSQEAEAFDQKRSAPKKDLAFDPKKLTLSLRSGFFHLYTYLALKIESAPTRLAERCEAQCPCHGMLLEGLNEYRRQRLMEKHYGAGIMTCPMAGKNLPELIAGMLEETMEEIWDDIEIKLRTKQLPQGFFCSQP